MPISGRSRPPGTHRFDGPASGIFWHRASSRPGPNREKRGKIMKVIIFGATGMLGQGVLLECLRDSGVELVLTVGRTSPASRDPAVQIPKLRELAQADLADLSAIEAELS